MIDATLSENLAAFALSLLASSDLPQVALEALLEGYESLSLAALAGSTDRELSPQELESLLVKGLKEVGLSFPTAPEAALTLRNYYARLVAAGQMQPEKGAHAIYWCVFLPVEQYFPSCSFVGDAFGIAELAGLYFRYDDIDYADQKARHEIDALIVEECTRISAASSAEPSQS